MKIFQVFHAYQDYTGSKKEHLVYQFERREDAEAFVQKYSHPHWKTESYYDICVGGLVIKEAELVTHAEFDLEKQTFEA